MEPTQERTSRNSHGRNFNKFLGVSEVFLRTIFVCDVFLETVVHQWSWAQQAALQKHIVLPILLCKTANFQGWGGEPPYIPLSFIPGYSLAAKKLGGHATIAATRKLRVWGLALRNSFRNVLSKTLDNSFAE